MGTSPLLGTDRVPERPEGTGTDRLGPSDTSDSGSDIVGADGAVDTDELGLSAEDVRRKRGAGADIGDANIDSNSDSAGTGERAEAGRDTLRREAPDIAPDHIEGDIEEEDLDEGGAVAPDTSQRTERPPRAKAKRRDA